MIFVCSNVAHFFIFNNYTLQTLIFCIPIPVPSLKKYISFVNDFSKQPKQILFLIIYGAIKVILDTTFL